MATTDRGAIRDDGKHLTECFALDLRDRIVGKACRTFDPDQPLAADITMARPFPGVEPLADALTKIFDMVFAEVLFEEVDPFLVEDAGELEGADDVRTFRENLPIRKHEPEFEHRLATVPLLLPPP